MIRHEFAKRFAVVKTKQLQCWKSSRVEFVVVVTVFFDDDSGGDSTVDHHSTETMLEQVVVLNHNSALFISNSPP